MNNTDNLSPLFIARRLKFIREYSDMTCQQLADIMGISKQAVSRYEKGDLNPSNVMFDRLCKAFKVSPKFFTQIDLTIRLFNNQIIIE